MKLEYKAGVYMPMTESGTILVDDTLASCYASLSDVTPLVMETSKKWFHLKESDILHWWSAPF